MERFEQIITSNLKSFDDFEFKCKQEYDAACTSLAEMRTKQNKKIRGDVFECFALRYLKHVYTYKYKNNIYTGLSQLWLFNDIPDDIKEQLGLGKVDLGIDLIGTDIIGRYYAIQVKFRSPNKYKPTTGIGWKQLSTFYGIVNKTGPWWRHIVFTNANYVRHVGQKSDKDYSICRLKLQKLSHMDFLQMSESVGRKLNEDVPEIKKPIQNEEQDEEQEQKGKEEIEDEDNDKEQEDKEQEEKRSITLRKAKRLSKKKVNMDELRANRLKFFENK